MNAAPVGQVLSVFLAKRDEVDPAAQSDRGAEVHQRARIAQERLHAIEIGRHGNRLHGDVLIDRQIEAILRVDRDDEPRPQRARHSRPRQCDVPGDERRLLRIERDQRERQRD